MSVSSTQPEKEHLYCLMARVATPATQLVASSGIPTLQLPFGGDAGDCGVTLVEDEAGTDFKFSDVMPGTLGHSDSIGNLVAIGDRDRIDVDAADTFLHTPLLAAGLLLEEDDDPQIVMLVEDEDGTEFKFSVVIPDTLGHSD